jgi:hypothetical protein
VEEIMRAALARFRAKRTCPIAFSSEVEPVRVKKTRQTNGQKRQRPQQGGRYPFVTRLNGNQPA